MQRFCLFLQEGTDEDLIFIRDFCVLKIFFFFSADEAVLKFYLPRIWSSYIFSVLHIFRVKPLEGLEPNT